MNFLRSPAYRFAIQLRDQLRVLLPQPHKQCFPVLEDKHINNRATHPLRELHSTTMVHLKVPLKDIIMVLHKDTMVLRRVLHPKTTIMAIMGPHKARARDTAREDQLPRCTITIVNWEQ